MARSHAIDYRSSIRNNVRSLWKGFIDWEQFYNLMVSAIERYVPLAFYQGARECGIQPSELKPDERQSIQRNIAYERQWIAGFADAVEVGSQANEGKLGALWPRAEVWIGRFQGIVSEARATACADKKLEWVQGPTSDRCSSCTKLSGKVKRGSYWAERSIFPRVHGAPYLECSGFRCLCQLLPTDKPMSKGPLPNLP